MAETMEQLPLGTTEAAVRSCVSVIAAVTSQREEILAYWLDLYYQVRRAYEIEQGREENPRLIRREDLYPAMREMMRDALKSTAREEAGKRAKAKKNPSTPLRSAQDDRGGALRSAQDDRGGALRFAQDDKEERIATPVCGLTRNDVEAGGPAEAEGDGADESAPPSESRLDGFDPVNLEPCRGWAAKKAAIRDRLLKARAEGVTIAEIINAGGKGVCFESEVFGILNAAKMDMQSYRRVEAALDALGR